MKMYTISSVLLIAAVLCAPGVIEAGKPLETAERTMVGEGRDLVIVPNLNEAVRIGGGKIWAETVNIKDAYFLKPHFVGVNLRAGDAIVVRSSTGRVVETITGRGPKNMGTFWGLSARGEELHLELHMRHDYAVPPFQIDKVVIGDVDPFGSGGGSPESVCGSANFEDVVCYEGDADKWANVMASVGVMNIAGNPHVGALWCSGSNISSNNYVLTNDHCLPSQAACDTAEFVFKYFNETCGGGDPTNDWVSYRCDDVMVSSPWGTCEATPSTMDFALASVIGDPASTFGFVSADPHALTDGEAIYIVQHPVGRPHEIVHGDGADVDADSPNLRYYNTLDSDGGSSGSPIFRETDHKLVGLHHCGGCEIPGSGNRGMMMSDLYPMIEDYLCSSSVDVIVDGIQGLGEVSGNGDSVLDPGESWYFKPVVHNSACTDNALGVTGDIVPNAGSIGPLVIGNGAASFGDVSAGESVESQQAVIFDLGLGAECGEKVILDLVNIDATNGGPFDPAEGILSMTVGELVFQTILLESFAGGIPANWTVVHNGTGTGPAATWTTDNPGGVVLSLTEPFAIVDSDEAGSGATHDEELITPEVDCSGYEQVHLRFNHEFRWWSGGGNEQCDVDVRSAATGGSWVNVVNYSGDDRSGNEVIDISAHAVGQTDVEVRFRYYDAAFEYWWAVDDVEIVGGSFVCGGESGLIFNDGFESHDTSEWSQSTP